jgi:cysteine dioxygenase
MALPFSKLIAAFRYTRTLVGFDNHFVALLLCWGKGQQSPIHDHAGASCWVKMLAGDLEEVLYDRDNDGKLVKVKRTLFSAGTDDDV